jgi:hypothetical protein
METDSPHLLQSTGQINTTRGCCGEVDHRRAEPGNRSSQLRLIKAAAYPFEWIADATSTIKPDNGDNKEDRLAVTRRQPKQQRLQVTAERKSEPDTNQQAAGD